MLFLVAGCLTPALGESTADANAGADITVTETDAGETGDGAVTVLTGLVEQTVEVVDETVDETTEIVTEDEHAEIEAEPATTQPVETEADGLSEAEADRVMDNRIGELVPTQAEREAALSQRMHELVQRPGDDVSDEAVYEQLNELNSNAIALYNNARPGPMQLQALSVQMQADYASIVDAPSDADISGYLTNLRTNARWAKTLDLPDARSTGDFWLMTADLVEINRSRMPLSARQQEAAERMDTYLLRHPDAAPAKSVRQALVTLNQARGLAPEPVIETPSSPTPATQPATTQPATTQPAEADASVLEETADTVTDAAEDVGETLDQSTSDLIDKMFGD